MSGLSLGFGLGTTNQNGARGTPELLTNGSFDGGLTGWDDVSQGTPPSPPSASGSAAILPYTNDSNRAIIRQLVSAAAGDFTLVVDMTNSTRQLQFNTRDDLVALANTQLCNAGTVTTVTFTSARPVTQVVVRGAGFGTGSATVNSVSLKRA